MAKEPEKKKIHFFIDGADFYECGVSGPQYVGSNSPEGVTCLRCLKNMRKDDEGDWWMRAHSFPDGTYLKRHEMPWVAV